MSRKGIPEKMGMLTSGHKTERVYRHNIIDMEVFKPQPPKSRSINERLLRLRITIEQP
jgi:hypothetical protein